MPTPSPSPADVIAGSAESGGEGTAPTELNELAERLAKMELAFEQIALSTTYQSELADYVHDLRDEVASIRLARKIVGGVALVAAIALFVAPIVVAANDFPWFKALPPYVAAALLIGMLAAGVLLLSTIAKSVFRSAAERQGDEFIPPQIKLIHDLLGGGR